MLSIHASERHVSAPLCPSCHKPMQLIFKDRHPIRRNRELRAFECSGCLGPVLTKTVSIDGRKRSSYGNSSEEPEVQQALDNAKQNRDLAAAAGTPEERDSYLLMEKKWVAIAGGWKQIVEVSTVKKSSR
jgi:hypothetical protein